MRRNLKNLLFSGSVLLVAAFAATFFINSKGLAQNSLDPDADGCVDEVDVVPDVANPRAYSRIIDESTDPDVCHDAESHTGIIRVGGTAEIKDISTNDVQRITNEGPGNVTYSFDGDFKAVTIPSAGFALLESLTDQVMARVKGGESSPSVCDLFGSIRCQMPTSSRLNFPILKNKEIHTVSGSLEFTIEKHHNRFDYDVFKLVIENERTGSGKFEYFGLRTEPPILPLRLDFTLEGSSRAKGYLGGTSFDDAFMPEVGIVKVSCTASSDPSGDNCFYQTVDEFIRNPGGRVVRQPVSEASMILKDSSSRPTFGDIPVGGIVPFKSAEVRSSTGKVIASFDDHAPGYQGTEVNKLVLAPKGRTEEVSYKDQMIIQTLINQTKRTIFRF